jgi:C-methyltransferase
MDPANMACGGWMAAAVGAAARLGIADLLTEGPRSSADLAVASGTSEPVLHRVLRLLASLGVFRQTPDGRFENTADSERLRTDHPRSVRHFCQLAAGDYDRCFDELGHSLKNGEPASRTVFGGSIYEYMARTPAAAEVYDLAMEDLARPACAALASIRDFSDVRTVVDVGGGRGGLAKGLVAAHPHLTGTVVDLPDVCARATADLVATKPALATRLSYAGGDFFASVPAGADVYLLKNVLHNWNDDSSERILATVRAAMDGHASARLLVIEPLVHDGPQTIYEAMDDLMQVVVCEPGTTARSDADLRRLLDRAALEVVGVELLATGHSVLEAVVPTRQ